MKATKTPSRQSHEGLATSTVKFVRSNILLVGIIAIEIAYFLSSMIDGTLLIRTILAFPAAFIAPGFALRLLVSKSDLGDIPKLLVTSFVISTVINVVSLSLLILINVQHYSFLLPLSQLLLVVFAAVLMKVRNDMPRLSIEKVDGLIILTCFIAYLVAMAFYSATPRLPTPDETSYIANARSALLSGKVVDINAGSATSTFTYLTKGKFLWTLLTASFLASTGLKSWFSHLLSPMFLAMIPLASLSLLPETLERTGLLRFSMTIFLLTNPLLFYFSGFILNDLALAFYITFALALFVNSFRQDRFGNSIDLSKLTVCFIVFFMAMIFIKANIAIFFSMYIVLLYFALRRGTHMVHKRLVYALLIFPILYELLIDVPFNVFNWFLKNGSLAQLFSRFLWVSPLEYFSGLFVGRPWKSTTLFSHSTPQYLQLVYTMISPEVLGLLLASMALAAPLALARKWVRRDPKMLILSLLLTITVPTQYLIMISNYSFRDAPRFVLFLFPLTVAFSLAILSRETDEHNVSSLFMFCIPAVLFLWLFFFLSVHVGGVYFYYSYGTPPLSWTIRVVALQFIIYVYVLYIMSARRKTGVPAWTLMAKLEKVRHLSLSRILYSTLVIAITLQNVYFSIYCVENSSFFGQGHGLEDTSRFLASANDNSLIISNSYIYMRNYVSDDVLADGRLFPPPKTENEFLRLLDFAPNGSIIFISNDTSVTWLGPANNYIKRYVDRNVITSNASNANAIRIMNEQSPTGQISVFRTVNSFHVNKGVEQVVVNDVRLVWFNEQEKALELNVSSSAPGYIKTIIETVGSIELFNITLLSGNNVVKLNGGPSWRYLSNVRVFAEDENGNIVYDGEVHMFNAEEAQLSFTLISISLLSVFLFLMRRFKPTRVRAYLVSGLAAERIRARRANCMTERTDSTSRCLIERNLE